MKLVLVGWKGMDIVMENQVNNELAQLRKELRITRIFCGVSSVLAVVLLIGGGLVFGWMKECVESIWPIVENLSTVDFENLNQTLYTLNDSLNSMDWTRMSAQLEMLDVEAINEALEGLDTQELSKALENLNSAAETLQRLGDGLKSFLSKFGL